MRTTFLPGCLALTLVLSGALAVGAQAAATPATLPAHEIASATGQPTAPATGQQPTAPATGPQDSPSARFSRLDLGATAKIVDLPRSLAKDTTVSALVQLTAPPIAGSSDQAVAKQDVKAEQDEALPDLRDAGATVQGKLGTVLNAVRVRARVRDLAKIAAVDGVRTVEVSRQVLPANATAERFTGVDKTWQDLGATGKGQVIGVIDTGLDYTHADFGGPGTTAAYKANDGTVIEPGSFPTAKVTGGYDFVGDTYNAQDPDSVPQPDPDPLDCEGHGTHTAGTAAGQGVLAEGHTYAGPYDGATLNTSFTVAPGSAPQAALRAYRVFGCDGSANDDVISAAIDRAAADHVDVINMSLGSTFGTNDDLETQAIENATKAGVLVVASAGNEGSGAYVVGTPGTADAALSVAAVDASGASFGSVDITGGVTAATLNANDAPIPAPISGTLVDVGLGCAAADYSATAGKIAVTTRGVCARADRPALGQAAGALAVIMINDSPGLPPFEGPIPGVSIPFLGADGSLAATLHAADGRQVTLTRGTGITNPGYTQAADFSSNGPRRLDDAQKPDVAAPGVSLFSAQAGSGTGAIAESGTSMSSPHTAGIAALVGQTHPNWAPLQIKAAIMSTADPSRVGQYDSRRVGTGLVQPRKAAASRAFLSTADELNSLRFGLQEMAAPSASTRSFTVTNQSQAPVTYDLSTALSGPGLGADLSLSPRVVTVPAWGDATVSLTIGFSAAAVAALPGASDSDNGALTALHGTVVATPRGTPPGIYPLRIAFLTVPAGLSSVQPLSLTPHGISAGSITGDLTVRNNGIHAGTADLYDWLLSDPAGDVTDPDTPDLVDVGVQSLPGGLVGAPTSDRLMVFAVNAAQGTSTQATHEIDLGIDTDRDGVDDFYVFAYDRGAFTTGSADGTLACFVVTPAGAVVDAYSTSAPANGSTIEMPVLTSDLGLTASSGAFAVTAAGYSAVSSAAGDTTTRATFDPFHPGVSQGDLVPLAPGQTTPIPVSLSAAEGARQHSKGWLVVTQDDHSGTAEADRVPLTSALRLAMAKAATG